MEPTRPGSNEAINVMIVEDDEIFRYGLRVALEPFCDQLAIVAEADNAADAVAKVEEIVPDVVLMDLHIPHHSGDLEGDWRNGVETIAELRRIAPYSQVLVLSHLGKKPLVGRDLLIVFEALRAGARGYITKDDRFGGKALADAIIRIKGGESIYGSAVAQRLQENPKGLTPREREVLDLLAEGKSDQAIADELFITVKGVKAHVSNILLKLHVRSRHIFDEAASKEELVGV